MFPVFTEGDMPSSCDLELRSGDALSNLKRVAAKICVNCDTFSHSLHVLFTSKIFFLWLSAVLADSEFFLLSSLPFSHSKRTFMQNVMVLC